MAIKLAIAYERGIVREGLCSLFSARDDVEVIGEADDVTMAVQLAGNPSLQVLIVSRQLGDCPAEEIVRRIIEVNAAVRIIGVSDNLDIQSVRQFLAAGGSGFITKNNGFSEIIRATHAVLNKRVYMSPDVADAMVAKYVLTPMGDPPPPSEKALSARQREVLQHVAKGMTTKDTAAALNISTKTVDMHRQRIMNKLKIHSVARLTKYAIRQGLAELQY